MITLAVSESEADTSENLTHQAKLDAVDFGTEEPRAANFSMKSATSILVALRNTHRLNDRLCARSVPADGAVVEMIFAKARSLPDRTQCGRVELLSESK